MTAPNVYVMCTTCTPAFCVAFHPSLPSSYIPIPSCNTLANDYAGDLILLSKTCGVKKGHKRVDCWRHVRPSQAKGVEVARAHRCAIIFV